MSVLDRLKTLEEIDTAQGLKTVAGNETIYLKLLGKIEPLVDKSLGVLRGADPGKNLQEIAFEAHSIKGAMYNLGVARIGDEAKIIELAAKNGEADAVSSALPPFIERVDDFKRRLAEALKG